MKMYFFYGVMGSSKTAIALMKKFSFEEHGRNVALLKPSLDIRDGEETVKSRIGLSCTALVVSPTQQIWQVLEGRPSPDVIIVDEAQFLNSSHVDELRALADSGTMIMCYGLKCDYMGHLFEGSRRLIELSDTLREIQTMCVCGKKAIMNARYRGDKIIYKGEQIDIGGNDKYIALCHSCWAAGHINKLNKI